MPKNPAKLRPDVAEIAFRTMMEATGEAVPARGAAEQAQRFERWEHQPREPRQWRH